MYIMNKCILLQTLIVLVVDSITAASRAKELRISSFEDKSV